MNVFILINFFNSVYFTLALSHLQLHCNFSNYILNFFKHNEKYLLKIEKQNNIFPVSLDDLYTYGEALQTHGDIGMAMLDALRSLDQTSIPNDLMAINLYLNNVSGSLMFIARNDVDNYDWTTLSVIKGYRMLHRSMVDQFENFVQNDCGGVMLDEEFIKCPDYNTTGIYKIKFLHPLTKKLKNRLIQTTFDKNEVVINDSEVFVALRIALESKRYNEFHPKLLFFYDFMNSHDQVDKTSNIIQNIQQGRWAELQNKLDLFRCATIRIKSTEASYLSLTDVLRYMLFNFDGQNMKTFQEIILSALFQPLGILIRTFCIFAKNCTISNQVNNLEIHNFMRIKIQKVADDILTVLKQFISFQFYGKRTEDVFNILLCDYTELLESGFLFNSNNDYLNNKICNTVRFLLMGNYLKFVSDTLDLGNVNNGNIKYVLMKIEEMLDVVATYTTKLDSFKDTFKYANNTYVLEILYAAKNKGFINDKNIDYILNFKEYADLYKYKKNSKTDYEIVDNNDFEFDVEDLLNDLYSELVGNEICDDMEYDTPNTEVQSVYSPKYMQDYLTFELPQMCWY